MSDRRTGRNSRKKSNGEPDRGAVTAPRLLATRSARGVPRAGRAATLNKKKRLEFILGEVGLQHRCVAQSIALRLAIVRSLVRQRACRRTRRLAPSDSSKPAVRTESNTPSIEGRGATRPRYSAGGSRREQPRRGYCAAVHYSVALLLRVAPTPLYFRYPSTHRIKLSPGHSVLRSSRCPYTRSFGIEYVFRM